MQDALNNLQMFEYLAGLNGYAYVSNYADAPTETQDVFSSVTTYVGEDTNHAVWKYFETSWVDLSESREYSWLSLYYLYEYLNFLNRKKILSDPKSKQLISVIAGNVSKNKISMKEDKRWVGRGYKDGLWGDAQRLINNINDDYYLGIVI